ncbi:hypothetical protein [Anaerorhabdus sp.]|uniref:hypothetical protein n=1 Tax=Anaerorhabdus sp. TaxID=1872524 RepID=UPI002FCA9FDB
MENSIVVALITGLCVAVPSVLTNVMTNRKSQAIMTYRLDSIEKKQDKHNAVIERTYNLEKDMMVVKEQMKVANHRIEDLEK